MHFNKAPHVTLFLSQERTQESSHLGEASKCGLGSLTPSPFSPFSSLSFLLREIQVISVTTSEGLGRLKRVMMRAEQNVWHWAQSECPVNVWHLHYHPSAPRKHWKCTTNKTPNSEAAAGLVTQ